MVFVQGVLPEVYVWGFVSRGCLGYILIPSTVFFYRFLKIEDIERPQDNV